MDTCKLLGEVVEIFSKWGKRGELRVPMLSERSLSCVCAIQKAPNSFFSVIEVHCEREAAHFCLVL